MTGLLGLALLAPGQARAGRGPGPALVALPPGAVAAPAVVAGANLGGTVRPQDAPPEAVADAGVEPAAPAGSEAADAPDRETAPPPVQIMDHFSIVNPEQVYTYELLTSDLQRMAAQYPDLARVRTLGQTAYGREIWALGLGTGPGTVLLVGAHHGSEWLTANLMAAMADRYALAATVGETLGGFNVNELLRSATLWFVPMLNPDGVTLSQVGLSAFPAESHARFLAWNGGRDDFRGWKANGEGIDLNRQYPAEWAYIAASPAGPSFSHYKGAEPLVASESRALFDFTLALDPEMVVAYHSAGQVIFWHFHTWPENVERDHRIAERLSGLTGYDLLPPEENPSGGGYKDWFVQTVGRPGFTLEIGRYTDGGPLPLSAFAEEWQRNRAVGLALAEEAVRLDQERGAR
ncbi:MAG: carboxypeptidase [Symbiobacteriaceae bacterium]|nr:carboxypeptidase [Symbiobacteriaceae bacterium]